MTRIFYKPRFKKGVLGNQKIIPIKKNFSFFKRLKWQSVDLKRVTDYNFFRNDTLVIYNQILDLRKQYKLRNTSKKSFFLYFSTLKNKELKKSFLLKNNQRTKSQKADFFYYLLEHRIDFALIKANFAKTVFQARWLINRGFVFVNKDKILSLSFMLKNGDFVRLSFDHMIIKKNKEFNPFKNFFSAIFLEICYETLSFIVLSPPKIINLGIYPYFFNIREIVSFFRK